MRVVFLFLLFLVNISFAETIFIAASANTQYALKEIIKNFKKKNPNINIKTSISSSGNLTAQIQRGAKYDIFLSADLKYPTILYKKGYAINKPKVYAEGILVLWSVKYPIKDIKDIVKFNKIALPNPRTAPYGRAGKEALEYYKLYNKIKNKLIFGESVGQTSQYIYHGLVDVGFTAKSIVLSPKIKNKGYWIEIDRNSYKPIKQAVVILKNGKNKPYVKKFFHYLFSKEAQNILMEYGYRISYESSN
jgi:molybdate transport system substrate-binding protein